MILLIDNYDSFVHNLARYVRELGCETVVVRNDAVSVADVERLAPQALIISPGPCSPAEAGISVPLIQALGSRLPMLGVCLGHQALCAACGGEVMRAEEPVHGRTSWVRHAGTPLFAGVANPFLATRYHSLVVDAATLPAELDVTAWTDDGVPMALEHRHWPLWGVQFHPESVLTQFGHRLLANFLELAGVAVGPCPPADWSQPLQPEDSASFAPITPVPW